MAGSRWGRRAEALFEVRGAGHQRRGASHWRCTHVLQIKAGEEGEETLVRYHIGRWKMERKGCSIRLENKSTHIYK
jgi:hypothetical protein